MLKPIKNNKQHEEALARAYALLQKNIKPNSSASDELEILSILIREYEKERYPVICTPRNKY
jgi:HTH-type transcriptional regulator/antitoxin HigA